MKTISKEQHLQALGLFTMAVHHAREADKFRKGLMRLLGSSSVLGCLDDAIFDDSKQRPEDLADALREEGYDISDVG